MLLVDSCIGDDAEETTLKKKIMVIIVEPSLTIKS